MSGLPRLNNRIPHWLAANDIRVYFVALHEIGAPTSLVKTLTAFAVMFAGRSNKTQTQASAMRVVIY
jgi:hypothetical protein